MPKPVAFNQAAFASNARNSADHTYASYPKTLDRTPVVLIPPLSADTRSSEYVTLKDDQTSGHQKDKHVDVPSVADVPTPARDQRAIADSDFNNLQSLIEDIFEADEQTSADNYATPSLEVAPHFIYVEQDDAQVRTLAPATLVKLDSLLQKATSAGSIGNVSVNDACRLQDLCDKSLKVVQSLELSIDTAWSSDDFLAWVQRASFAETALRSARSVVRIMVGFREEKSLCSEEALQNVVDVLNKILTSCIIPIVETRPKDSESELFEFASAHSKEIGQLLYHANRVMRLLVDMLDKVDIAEAIVTALEFFAIRVLFVENAQTEKESILGTQKFEGLRRTAMDIISGLFSKYPEQRAFIFDEILTSLQKLPIKGQNARQFKLSDGTSIQLVSALIMRLVQTSAAPAKSAPKSVGLRPSHPIRERKSQRAPSDSEEEVSSGSDDDHKSSEASSDHSDNNARNSASRRLANEANALYDYAARDAQYIVRYFVQRAMTASKTGDQPHRHLLDMFTDDLILVLGNAEWPAAELLLRALMVSMINIAENRSTAPAKNMALELLGVMGSAISELVATTQTCARDLENQDSPSSGYLRQLLDDYLDGSLDTAELTNRNGPYRMVMEYLASIDSDGLSTHKAQLYYLVLWARGLTSIQSSADSKREFPVVQLRKMLRSRVWDPPE